MKKLFSVLLFSVVSTLVMAQELSTAKKAPEEKNYTKKYFVSTNSGIKETPIGIRLGVLDKKGGYISARFGKGHDYETDKINQIVKSDGTMVSVTAGFILPVYYRENNNFKTHTFFGIGYGHWFNRPPKNTTTTGAEFEGGFMFSYSKVLVSVGGSALLGDGNSPKTDLTIGIGYKF